MSLVWLDYLALASLLSGAVGTPPPSSDDTLSKLREQPDACLLSAISRAYYAAFHAAQSYLRKNRSNVSIPTHGGAHEVVWATLKSGDRRERASGVEGERLKALRTKADYRRHDLRNLPAEVARALGQAENVLRSLGYRDDEGSG